MNKAERIAKNLTPAQFRAVAEARLYPSLRGVFPPMTTRIDVISRLIDLGVAGLRIGRPLTKLGLAVRDVLLEDRPICEPCGKPILRGQFIYNYEDVGSAHVNCDEPNATTDPAAIDPEAGPVYVLLGTPMMLFKAVGLPVKGSI